MHLRQPLFPEAFFFLYPICIVQISKDHHGRFPWMGRIRNEKMYGHFWSKCCVYIQSSPLFFLASAVGVVYTCGNVLCCVLLNFRDYHETERQN